MDKWSAWSRVRIGRKGTVETLLLLPSKCKEKAQKSKQPKLIRYFVRPPRRIPCQGAQLKRYCAVIA